MAACVLAACGPMDDAGLESGAEAVAEWREQTLPRPVESPHPYANNTRIERRVEAPAGARALRLVVRIRTEQNYDFVELLDEGGTIVQKLSGSADGLSAEIAGRVAIVRLTSDGSVTEWGFSITAFRYLVEDAPPPPPPSTGGSWREVPVSNVETPHPYRNDMDQRWSLDGGAGATKLRVHFTGFDTETGYDLARLYDASGREVAKYDGAKGSFVSVEIAGQTASLRFTSDYSVTKYGFAVRKLEAFVPASTGGCRSDRECASGQICRAGACETPRSNPSAALAEACDARTAPCAGGLVCAPDQNSALGGVCARPTWSRRPLAVPQSTDHPYKNRTSARYEVNGPSWAQRIRVVFDDFQLETNYDFATVEAAGRVVGRYTGTLGTHASAEIEGSRATVVFTSDDSVTARGFDLSRVDAHGVPDALVAISLDPRQCGSSRLPTDDAGLIAHLDGLGATVYGLRRYRFATNTCTACTCPTGERIVLLVEAKDAVVVKGISSATGVFGVQANDVVFGSELVALRVTPKQCASNPWDRASGTTSHQKVASWARSVGAEVYASWSLPARQSVCSGCACPTTDDLLVAAPAAAAATLSRYGFAR